MFNGKILQDYYAAKLLSEVEGSDRLYAVLSTSECWCFAVKKGVTATGCWESKPGYKESDKYQEMKANATKEFR